MMHGRLSFITADYDLIGIFDVNCTINCGQSNQFLLKLETSMAEWMGIALMI